MGGGQATSESLQPSDAEIVERVQGGDRDAFGVLVERYQGRAYGLAVRVLRDEEQARDAVQEALLKAYRAVDRFEGRSSFYTWLYRLVMNQCIDAKRRGKEDRQVEWEEERSLDVSAGAVGRAVGMNSGGAEDPVEAVSRVELGGIVAKAFDELPDDARRTLQLREIDGLGYAEIAKVLGIPKGTVMSRLHYARKRMKAALLEAGALDLADREPES